MSSLSGKKKYQEELFSEEQNYYNHRSEIATFYSGQKIFITGGLGFVGRVLLEKLLRCCPEITMVYLLIRAKKQKDLQTRFQEYFNNIIFDRLKREQKNVEKKIILIEGDMNKLNLGLSEEDRERIKDTNLIFHAASDVRFVVNIRDITNTNIRGTRDLLLLAQKMSNLKAFVYISTAYSNCIHKNIEEKFYEPPIKPDEIIKLTEILNDDQLKLIIPKLLGKWPNIYVFTKTICENTVRQYSNGIPSCIIRPSIITSTFKEPIPGWINNFYGVTGIALSGATGILHTFLCDTKLVCDLIPVDYVVNNTIVAAWDVAQKRSIPQNINLSNRNNKHLPVDDEIPIYNTVSSVQNPMNWSFLENETRRIGFLYPSKKVLWYYSVIYTKNYYVNFILKILLHWIPAIVLDSLIYLCGRKPFLFKIYSKLEKFHDVIIFFTMREWKFTNDNVLKLWNKLSEVDKHNFFFNIADLDWICYIDIYIKGLRVYLHKDPIETVEESKPFYERLKRIHYITKSLFYVLLVWMFYSLLYKLFSFFFSF